MRNPLQGYFSFTKKIYLWFLFADCEKIDHPKSMKIGCIFFIMLSNGCVIIQYPTILHAEIISFIEEAKEDFFLEYEEGNQLYLYFEEFHTNYDGYLCYVMQDFKGAHPLTHLKTFNYLGGKYLHLDELFTEKDYQLFAKEAQRVLLPKLKKEEMFLDEMFYPGIEPKKENYQNIILLDDSYLIYFEHYQIAPYGAGIQTLKIKR